jgi:hypothetical protein
MNLMTSQKGGGGLLMTKTNPWLLQVLSGLVLGVIVGISAVREFLQAIEEKVFKKN